MIASYYYIPPADLGTESSAGILTSPMISESASAFDSLYILLLLLALVSGIAFAGRAFWMGRQPKKADEGEGHAVFWWAAIPSALLFVLFIWGQNKLIQYSASVGDVMDVRVEASGGQWKINYPASPAANSRVYVEGCHDSGESTANSNIACASFSAQEQCSEHAECVWDAKAELPVIIVAKGTPTHLLMSAKDQSYSLHIPALRLQKAVIPGRNTVLNFTANEVGEFPFSSAGYQGASHPGMLGKLVVVEASAFSAELKKYTTPDRDDMTPVELGKAVFAEKGCAACHSITGVRLVGPALNGIFGKEEKMTDGSTHIVDAAYIKESILDPNSKVVDSYPPAMTPFAGLVTDAELDGLAAYIESLK